MVKTKVVWKNAKWRHSEAKGYIWCKHEVWEENKINYKHFNNINIIVTKFALLPTKSSHLVLVLLS